MNAQVPKILLNNGKEMPIVGLGTYARKANPGQFRQAVEDAINCGYRHIDTAAFYYNEEEVGQAINAKIKEGVVTREELFITTKLWNNRHAKEDVIPTLQESLARLELDYVDLYLVHWPISVSDDGVDLELDFMDTWQGMEDALELGLTKAIGVSNFNEEQLLRILENCNVKPVVNQVEINPTLTQKELVQFCNKQSVVPVAYTPLGLISEARPEFAGVDVIKTDPKLGDLAEKYGKTRAQVGLRYLVQRGIPVLPKSFTKSRIQENIDILDFELSETEMAIVDSYNINHRCVPASTFAKVKNYPF